MTHGARGDQGADCTRRQMAKFVVALDDKVAPTDIEEGMRVGVDRSKFKIKVPLPPKIDPSVRSLWPAVPVLGSSLFAAPLPTTQVTMMTVEEKPDVTYDDVGGAEESLEKLREVVELPLLHPERFVSLGIDPPKVRARGDAAAHHRRLAHLLAYRACCYMARLARARRCPLGRWLTARMRRSFASSAVSLCRSTSARAPAWCESSSRWHARARRASFSSMRCVACEATLCVAASAALVDHSPVPRPCQVDAIGGTRFEDQGGGDSDVQRTMLEIVNQLDGFDPRGNVKVLMATNRPDTLDPALMRPGRLDRKVEFGLPKLEGRTHIFRIHAKTMNCDPDIRYVVVGVRRGAGHEA